MRPVRERLQVPERRYLVKDSVSHKPCPQLFFGTLCGTLSCPIGMRHLVPDDRRQHMFVEWGTLGGTLQHGTLLYQDSRKTLPSHLMVRRFSTADSSAAEPT